MLKRFSDFAPIHFYKNLQGNIELSVLKEMPDDYLIAMFARGYAI